MLHTVNPLFLIFNSYWLSFSQQNVGFILIDLTKVLFTVSKQSFACVHLINKITSNYLTSQMTEEEYSKIKPKKDVHMRLWNLRFVLEIWKSSGMCKAIYARNNLIRPGYLISGCYWGSAQAETEHKGQDGNYLIES